MSMRITNKIMNDQSVSNINRNKTSLDRLNTQMSTGKKQSLLSDDPVIGMRALRFRGNLSEVTQYYGANVPDAKAWVGVSQKALDSTVELISDLKALCVQGSNGTYDAASRAKIYEDLMGTVKQVYHNGNANYAGRTVFTGYRTGENLTFDKDTTADYRDINDRFNASDVKIMTYSESPLTVDDINKISGDISETQVKEDRVNRIRLSYDNINGSVRRARYLANADNTGFDGDEAGTWSGWGGPNDLSKYYNHDGSLNDAGQGVTLTVAVDGWPVNFKFNDPWNKGLTAADYDHSSENVTDKVTLSPAADGFSVKYGDASYKVTKTASGYDSDYSLSVKDNGDGTLTLTVPGANGSTDVWTEITVSSDGSSVMSAVKNTKVTEWVLQTGEDHYGKSSQAGDVFATHAYDDTELIYRTEFTGTSSIVEGGTLTDTVDGLQSFKVECNGTVYTIQKFPAGESCEPFNLNPERFLAVDDTGDVLKEAGSGGTYEKVKVSHNSDGTFTIKVWDDSTKTSGTVFNVSANGRVIESSYREDALTVQITDSSSPVATDSQGKGITAYQYLALDDNDENVTRPEAADAIYLLADTGELVFGSNVAKILSSLKDIEGVDTISVSYDKSNFDEGDLRPEHYFDCREITYEHNTGDPVIYSDYDQEVYYSVGTRQKMQININACDAFDPQIVRMADDIINAIEACNAAEDKVNKLKEMQNDTTAFTDEDREKIALLLEAAEKEFEITKNDLQKAYERGITEFGDYHAKANLAATDCGTIDNRLTLISNRLMEEQSTVKTLASENENVEITHVAVQVQESEMIYNSALQAIGKINQRSLVDYL